MSIIEGRKRGKGRSNNSNAVNKDVISLLNSLDIFGNRPSQMPIVVPISIPSTTTSARRLSDPESPQKARRQIHNDVKSISLMDLLSEAGYQNEDYCEKALEKYLE